MGSWSIRKKRVKRKKRKKTKKEKKKREKEERKKKREMGCYFSFCFAFIIPFVIVEKERNKIKKRKKGKERREKFSGFYFSGYSSSFVFRLGLNIVKGLKARGLIPE